MKEEMDVGWAAIIIGAILIGVGYGSLFLVFKSSVKSDTNLSFTAIKAAYTLVVGGLVVVILGLLYLMRILPNFWVK